MTVQGIATSDFKSLNDLKVQAKNDTSHALPDAAKQFEGIFLQSMLKAMRMGQHFLEDSSPFSGKNQATFQEMLDGQYASTISNGKGIGLADSLSSQLEQSISTDISRSNESQLPSISHAFLSPELTKLNKTQDRAAETTIDSFVKSIWPMAKQAASAIGIDPKVLMAQAALETGWGQHIAKDADGASSNNLFNIKSSSHSNEESLRVQTTEYIANTPVKLNASFRKYASIEHSFNDYVSLIKESSRYQTALENANNPELYVNELHKAGYATDPEYGSKILSIYHGQELNEAIQRCGLLTEI